MSDPLGFARQFYRRFDDMRRILICDPADADRIRAALRAHGVAAFWEVKESPMPGRGNVWVSNPSVGNAAAERWQ